jgi:hypothetical protein
MNISLCNVSVVSVTCRTASSLVGLGFLSTSIQSPGSKQINSRNNGLCVSKYSGLQIRDRLFDLIHRLQFRALDCGLFYRIIEAL